MLRESARVLRHQPGYARLLFNGWGSGAAVAAGRLRGAACSEGKMMPRLHDDDAFHRGATRSCVTSIARHDITA